MSQLVGWRFLELGRRLERAIAGCRFIRQFAFGESVDGTLDALLELADSQNHLPAALRDGGGARPVIDLVALDPTTRVPPSTSLRASRRILPLCPSARREPAVAAEQVASGAGDAHAHRRRGGV